MLVAGREIGHGRQLGLLAPKGCEEVVAREVALTLAQLEHIVPGVQCEFALRLHSPAIDIHHVGNLLEGDEGDADGQRNLHPMKRLPAEKRVQSIHVIDEEVGVFEEEQQPDVEHQRKRQPPFARPVFGEMDFLGDEEVDDDGTDDHEDKGGFPPRVEEQTGEQQQVVLCFVRC